MNILKFIFLFLLIPIQVQSQIINITGPAGSGQFGKTVTVLTNGNFVVTDPSYDEGSVVNVGAVYLYNGSNHALISTLKGINAGDSIGSNGIVLLSNGNFVVSSQYWDNGTATDAGAITWCSSTSGVSGVISSSNSLVGSSASDFLNNTITMLSNGNYLVKSPNWNNGTVTDAGAVTWGNGSTGLAGTISNSNSLIGSTINDRVGLGVTALINGNYVVSSPYWDNGTSTDAGAVTFGNGNTGITGIISSSNSLVGSTSGNSIGENGVTALNNGNYVVKSRFWDNGVANDVGAVTWGNGNTGITGIVSSSNSLVGNTANDNIGGEVIALSNGNCVVKSPWWNNGVATDAGACTWFNDNTGITGIVSSSNSLVGSSSNDRVGDVITPLSNGNYVVISPGWSNGSSINSGAVTFGNGTIGITGTISNSNSLIGTTTDDQIGGGSWGGVIALNNGNYVVHSPNWDNGVVTDAGAVTWGNGTAGITGIVSSSNSLLGSTVNDRIGGGRIYALMNGNYVVSSPYWDNGVVTDAGAATWGNGTAAITGIVSSSNSLVGNTVNDRVGGGVTALMNGNYLVNNPYWDNGSITDAGAVTWGNGINGITGIVSSNNSLVGSKVGDWVGHGGITVLSNDNYVVRSDGGVTWGDGTLGITGAISTSNSLVGSTVNDWLGSGGIDTLSNGNYVVNSPAWDNGTITDAGAVTWANGTIGISGIINSNNSLLGNTYRDRLGVYGAKEIGSGDYVVISSFWHYGTPPNNGAVTWGSGTSGVVGNVTSCNSVTGTGAYIPADPLNLLYAPYNATYGYLIVGRPPFNTVSIYNPIGMSLAITLDAITTNINGNTATPLITSAGCRIIATLTPNGTNPVNGIVNAKVWVESTVPTYGGDPFVARHYEITPATNATTATGNITLYFTQQEFNDFNAHAGSILNLPTDDADAAGISNLRIGKYPGNSNNGSGLPGTYSGTTEIIDPDDADIVWNGSLNRWEVSFNVTGFSGFIVQTRLTALPLQLLNFSAVLAQNDVLVSWRTTNEINTKNFEVERSTDGRNFITVGKVTAINNAGDHSYHYTDVGAALLNASKLYYRLKQIDNDGRFSNSQIVLLHLSKSNSITVYPNPVSNMTTLSFSNNRLLHTQAVLIDIQGKRVKQFIISNYEEQIDMSHLPGGMYILKLDDGTAIKLIKN